MKLFTRLFVIAAISILVVLLTNVAFHNSNEDKLESIEVVEAPNVVQMTTCWTDKDGVKHKHVKITPVVPKHEFY